MRILRSENFIVQLDCTIDVRIEGREDAIQDLFVTLILFEKGSPTNCVELADLGDHYGMRYEKKKISVKGIVENIKHKKNNNGWETLSFQLVTYSKWWRGCFAYFRELDRLVMKNTGAPCCTYIDEKSYRRIKE